MHIQAAQSISTNKGISSKSKPHSFPIKSLLEVESQGNMQNKLKRWPTGRQQKGEEKGKQNTCVHNYYSTNRKPGHTRLQKVTVCELDNMHIMYNSMDIFSFSSFNLMINYCICIVRTVLVVCVLTYTSMGIFHRLQLGLIMPNPTTE